MTTIGELRHRISFQSLTRTPDGLGGATESWATVVTVWASIEPAGKERNFAQRIEDVYTHKIRIRKRTDITATMRVLFGSRIFQVKAIAADLERKDFQTVLAEEFVGT